tara:strand:+ start:781 stop:2040 length:1260 start_codon:yes stop_codon:yes gene_type:complete
MNQNLEINSDQINQMTKISTKEREFRIKNLKLFNETGFPNKRDEDWKFSDFREIVEKNFQKLDTTEISTKIKKINLIKDFEHNYVFLINGNLDSSNFKYEDKSKIKLSPINNDIEYQIIKNPLICLNHALAKNGYTLEISKNYKFKKSLVIYNFFTEDVKNRILNSKNFIKVNENAEVHIIEYTINESKFKFINNVYENVILEKNAKCKNLILQNNRSEGFFHKYLKNKLYKNSDYSNFIFSSGLKFNKIDIECDLMQENSKCNILSGIFLNNNEHQEIKTLINHFAPNCLSYQRVKKVLSADSKGVYQGKIYVKDLAQKTDAYQLSKALLLNDSSEFNSKPELEIYADDVKCSHGSTSGSIDEDSLYYLMTRGLKKEDAAKLLIKGFLNDVVEFIKSNSMKSFVQSKIEEHVNGHRTN